MWTNNLITAVLGVGLLLVLAVVLALAAEIIRQVVLDKQDKPIQRSVDELAKRRGNNDTTRVG
ncbi:hypothetical protein NIF40_09090 [[Clostridium] leptum]|uniref:Uncharacterized protein n=1 Tax=Solibaculum mannosilyticum TaxID=2780922 RepID=A0A7I8D5S3_9FIRM|nr:hypothetical protein [Solibaculum mannosilyticum]MCO7137678.1 hypothetical protein [[Clostridium] leptum]BCI60829.1 hypothetical protein C12CBH8_14680 [Solibaculum mannosilyticum]